MPLPLFDEPEAPAPPQPVTVARESAAYGTRLYAVWWTNFRRGADGQSAPGEDGDPLAAEYARSGYRVGRLFRPLPCVREGDSRR